MGLPCSLKIVSPPARFGDLILSHLREHHTSVRCLDRNDAIAMDRLNKTEEPARQVVGFHVEGAQNVAASPSDSEPHRGMQNSSSVPYLPPALSVSENFPALLDSMILYIVEGIVSPATIAAQSRQSVPNAARRPNPRRSVCRLQQDRAAYHESSYDAGNSWPTAFAFQRLPDRCSQCLRSCWHTWSTELDANRWKYIRRTCNPRSNHTRASRCRCWVRCRCPSWRFNKHCRGIHRRRSRPNNEFCLRPSGTKSS